MVLHVDDDVEIAGGAAAGPASPSPVRRIRCPVAIPAGMRTVSFRSFCTRPAPWQVRQGLAMTDPVPRHWPQVRATVKKPC